MKPSMSNGENRKTLSEVALGNIPTDTVITNGTLFNVFTREFIKKQSIWGNGKALVEPRKIFFGEEQREMGKAHPYD